MTIFSNIEKGSSKFLRGYAIVSFSEKELRIFDIYQSKIKKLHLKQIINPNNTTMKKIYLVLLFISLFTAGFAQTKIAKIDPPYWYTGLQNKTLQLLIYGENISEYNKAKINDPLIKIKEVVTQESPNYLIVYLELNKDIKPGKFTFELSNKEGRTIKHDYKLLPKQIESAKQVSFDASDVLYLIMPDRFANGNKKNDEIAEMATYKVDRKDPNARHGGDLKGIEKHLNYFTDLGITTLWFTPVMENNEKGGSYHGYATTDYYNIDPRFGTNVEYSKLIEKAHSKGLKVIMDMIFNHCGINHPWIKDMPAKDWFNHSDYKNNYVQTSFKLTPHADPYASKYDFDKMNNGWFVPSMPDLNQKNRHVYRYLVQNSIWWIETSKIDGIRMDTHPYADYDAMSKWLKELNDEYPNFNVVGETWVADPAYTAWYQKDSKLSAPKNSNLKTVMDFSFHEKINQAKNEETQDWVTGLNRIYNNFVYDYLYPNPSSVLAFIENHDTNRFLDNSNDIKALKQAATILLTTRRIPQLYYGTEIMMNGTKDKSDGYVRKDFPGGWEKDSINLFESKQRSEIQQECFEFFKNLLHWRQNNQAIAQGKMIHFIPQNGVYVYARIFKDKKVVIIINGTNQEKSINLEHYKEVIPMNSKGFEVISQKSVNLSDTLKIGSRENYVIEIK